MTAARALCPVASVELGEAEIGHLQAQHVSRRYNISNRQVIMAGFPNGLQVGGSLCQLAINLNGYG